MQFVSRYVSHQPDTHGMVAYSQEEHAVWQLLYERQMRVITGKACDEFIQGLEHLGLSGNHIPQLPDLSKRLHALTGWQVAGVDALISAEEFFQLLARQHFPVATFIRHQEELNYVKEPDIFHEVFGHCPMLTHAGFAHFIHNYALKVLASSKDKWPLLQRLFWFTVEFGLMNTKDGLRAYGGGILSSINETTYSVTSDIPLRALFDPVAAFRTPYRIDMLQPVYFVIDGYAMLYDLVATDLDALIERAHELGEYPPLFAVDPNNPNIHILAC